MKSLSFTREALLLLIPIYYSQGALIQQGSIITKLSLLVILALSFYYILKVIFSMRTGLIFIWSWFSLLLLNVVGYFITLDFSHSLYLSQIKTIVIFFSIFFPFYYLASKNNLKREHLLRFFCLMLLLSIANFNHAEELILANRARDNSDVVNNMAYMFVFLIPYIFLFKNRILAFFCILVALFFIIQGAKRGAVIIGGVGMCGFLYHMFINTDEKNRVKGILIGLVALFTLVFFTYHFYLNNDYLMSRMLLLGEGGSGRSNMYLSLLQAWYDSDSLLNYIFGYGFVSSIEFSGAGLLAHNDWLELLINFGLFGVGLYLILFYCLFRICFFQSKNKIIIVTVATMWLLTTLFSMVYTSNIAVVMSILLAYLLGVRNTEKVA